MNSVSIALVALMLIPGIGAATDHADAKPAQDTTWSAPPPPPAPLSLRAACIPDAGTAASVAPPVPPPLPEIPAEAHAACKSKANGSKLTFTSGPGETMRGRCQRIDGRMVLQLRSYQYNRSDR